jgi:tetratricopeptide (TPR) repeat protein
MKSSLIRINPIFILLVLFIPNLTSAETKTFIKEYTYQASEADSKLSSRTIALEQVKRLLLEELGTYLESQTEIKDFHLTKDQIVVLTAGIVSADMLSESWDGKAYYLKAKILADPAQVAKGIDELRRNRQQAKELEDAKKRTEILLQEVERLKKELKTGKTAKNEKSQEEYNDIINKLLLTHLYEKASSFFVLKNYEEAIKTINEAIALDPSNDACYLFRAVSNFALENYEQSLEDCNKLIQRQQDFPDTYFLRGKNLFELEKYVEAIEDFNKAVRLDYHPQADRYKMRGSAYFFMGRYGKSLNDFSEAIKIKPSDSEAYLGRGIAWYLLDNHQRATLDFTRAIRLDPKCSEAYAYRGFSYWVSGKNKQAKIDLRKASELDPKFAILFKPPNDVIVNFDYRKILKKLNEAIKKNAEEDDYCMRGNLYLMIAKYTQALNDFDKALELNQKAACAIMGKGVSYIMRGKFKKGMDEIKNAANLGDESANSLLNYYDSIGLIPQ